jgi:hypothetical protein
LFDSNKCTSRFDLIACDVHLALIPKIMVDGNIDYRIWLRNPKVWFLHQKETPAMNAHVIPEPAARRAVDVNRVKDEFGELHAAIRILTLLAHEFPTDGRMHDLIGWQALHVERLADGFTAHVEAQS